MEKCYITDNNVNIYHYPGEHLHGFCVSAYMHAGSLYESESENGISHFLEHVIIRNINHLMDGKLYGYLDRYGLIFNACTYKEFVQFEITGASGNFRRAVDVLVRIFEEISLPASEIDIERKRIKAEIREDDEKSSLGYFTGRKVWGGTSASQMITGKSSVLDRMGKNVLQKAHQELMSSGNMFFYVTGSPGEAEISYLSAKVSEYELNGSAQNRDDTVDIPEGFGERSGAVYIKKSTDTVVRFSFDMPESEIDQAVYMLLYDILFECENSKIHQALSEEAGFIYSFDSGMEQYRNIGNLYFQYEVQPSKLLESVEIVVEIFRKLKAGITDELDYVKAAYIDNSELILDHAGNLNWTQAYEGHILGKTDTDITARKKAYEAVTPEMVTVLARSIFTADNMMVTAKAKKSKSLEKEIRKRIAEIDRVI